MTDRTFAAYTGAQSILDGAGLAVESGLTMVGTDTSSNYAYINTRHYTCFGADGDVAIDQLPKYLCIGTDGTNFVVADLPRYHCDGYEGVPAPDLNVEYGNLPRYAADGVMHSTVVDGVGLAQERKLTALGTDTSSNYAYDNLPRYTCFGTDAAATIDNTLLLIMTPGYLSMTSGHYLMEVDTGGDLALGIRMDVALALLDTIIATDQLRMPGSVVLSVTDTAALRAISSFIVGMVFNATAAAHDTFDETRHMLSVASDILLATTLVDTPYQGRLALAAYAVLSGKIAQIDFVPLTAAAVASAVADADVARIANMLDTLAGAAAFDDRLSTFIITNDAGAVGDTLTEKLAAGVILIDDCFVGGRFSFGGIPYTIYSMSTVGAGTSEIEGWDDYDSFFTLNGVAYATCARGIVRLDGDTDEGAAIDSLVRVGLNNFGSSLQKRIPNVYIGYTTSGRLALGVVSAAGGVKKINWYALNAVAKATDTGGRFDIDKGLASVYWDFEIRNLEGADFTLEFMKVWKVDLTRRKQV